MWSSEESSLVLDENSVPPVRQKFRIRREFSVALDKNSEVLIYESSVGLIRQKFIHPKRNMSLKAGCSIKIRKPKCTFFGQNKWLKSTAMHFSYD